MLEKLNLSYLTGLVILMLLMWCKNHLLRCLGYLSLLNWIGALTESCTERESFCEIPLPEAALYLCKPTIRSCMEYCYHVGPGAPSCYLDMLHKLQKRICRTVRVSIAATLEPLAHCRNIFSLTIALVDVPLNCLSWFHFLIVVAGPLVILIGCMIFLLPFLDVKRMFMSTSFFHRIARFCNSLSSDCFPLIYDVNGFKSRVNRHLFSFELFLISFPISFSSFLLFLVTPCFVVAVACHGVKPK